MLKLYAYLPLLSKNAPLAVTYTNCGFRSGMKARKKRYLLMSILNYMKRPMKEIHSYFKCTPVYLAGHGTIKISKGGTDDRKFTATDNAHRSLGLS